MADYQKVPSEGSVSEDDNCQYHSAPQRKQNRNLIAWIWCSACTLITMCAVLFAAYKSTVKHEPNSTSTPMRFPTDFASVPDIPYVPKYFYNYYDFHPETHHLDINESAANPLYAGKPTEEMDTAWNNLLNGSYMMLSQDEREKVQDAAPWQLETIDKNVYMEVGVFHGLHCLNLIRKALEPDYYDVHTDFTAQLPDEWKRVHIYHCVEHLRQSIQCHGDLTPVPLFMADRLENIFLSHGLTHTCRDFEAIKRWRDERNQERKPFEG